MSAAEVLALFALLGVPVRPVEAREVAQAAARYDVQPEFLVAVCASMSWGVRNEFEPSYDRRRMLCAFDAFDENDRPTTPTATRAAWNLRLGLRVCGEVDGALRFAVASGRCRPIHGDTNGPRAVRYYRRLLQHRARQ